MVGNELAGQLSAALKFAGNRAPHASRRINNFDRSLKIPSHVLMEQQAAEAGTGRLDHRRSTGFLPIQAQSVVVDAPPHAHVSFRTRQRAVLERVRSKLVQA